MMKKVSIMQTSMANTVGECLCFQTLEIKVLQSCNTEWATYAWTFRDSAKAQDRS